MTQQKKPIVLFMLVDNLGWGDLGCCGGMALTPRLDQLASEGMRFQNYNVEAQCH
jgi:arylsulfatase